MNKGTSWTFNNLILLADGLEIEILPLRGDIVFVSIDQQMRGLVCNSH